MCGLSATTSCRVASGATRSPPRGIGAPAASAVTITSEVGLHFTVGRMLANANDGGADARDVAAEAPIVMAIEAGKSSGI